MILSGLNLNSDFSNSEQLKDAENIQQSSSSSQIIETLGWGNQTTFSGDSTDDTLLTLALENHSVIVSRKSTTTLSNGTTSSTNGSSTVLILIYDHNNSLVKHYHFGGTSNQANSEAYGIAKNPQGGFAISGCYWGGAAYIGNHRFSSYGNNGACFQGFLVSFNSTFEVDLAKEMNADGSNIANSNTWANLAIDNSGNIYISGKYMRCNSNYCLYFFDTDNSGNVKKTPSISSYCGASSGSSKGYVYVAKLSSSGSWQWVKVGGGSTTNPTIYDIEYLNGSVYIAGEFSSCAYGLSSAGSTSTSTANFGSFSFSATSRCYQAGTGVTCGGFYRAFVAELSSSGAWTQLINTSGNLHPTNQNVAIQPPGKLDLSTDETNLLIAGQYSSTSWGLKFGNYTLPSTGKNSFFAKFAENMTYLDSFVIGSATDQVACPSIQNVDGEIFVYAKYFDDFEIANVSLVRSTKGEVFVKLDSNFTPTSMIDLSGTDASNCNEISSVGSKIDSYYAIVIDAMGATVGPISYTSSGGSYPAVADFGDDFDGDAIADVIDNDDDGDSVSDSTDSCPKGSLFLSRLATDRDQDGCRDSDEDIDDDGDGKNDTSDQCATGTMYWIRNSTTDYDDDGCNDASEDFNDDNDNFQDFEDMCPRLVGNSTYTNEKGCPDDDGDWKGQHD